MGFEQCASDPCVFFWGKLIILHFVEDCICLSPDSADVDRFIANLQAANFNVTDEGRLSDYLGVKIEKLPEIQVVAATSNCPDPRRPWFGQAKHTFETDSGAVIQNYRTRGRWQAIQRALGVSIGNWQTELLGEIGSAQYWLCHSPMCSL